MATFNLNSAIPSASQNQVLVNNTSQPNTLNQSFGSTSSNLPFDQIPPNQDGQIKRNIITWFVPQFGAIRMYINPQSITYSDKKLITPTKTKGGYTLQYWGEELTTLNIVGTTGSSGIEGINMLREMYRAEQLAFDAVATTLEGNNASLDLLGNLNQGIGSGLGSMISGTNAATGAQTSNFSSASQAAGILGGVLGLDSPSNSLLSRNVPSLAQLAFGVEMYYGGWMLRGFFTNFTVNEQASDFLFGYTIGYTVTQWKGYRTNYFPFHRSANQGPSQYNTPNSFNGNLV